MNSVHLFVRDCAGFQYLDTFTANTPENIAAFRKHARWWIRYTRTREYREATKKDHRGAPGFPVKICVEPYEDGTCS